MLIDLDPVDRITADAVGQPGERVFYLQGRKGDRLVTILLEKQQVQLLAASVVEILSRVDRETGQGPDEQAMALEEPLLPEWRAGRLSIGYHEERDLLLLEVDELVPDEEDDEAEPTELAELARELGLTTLEGDEEELEAETDDGDVEGEGEDEEGGTLADVADELEAAVAEGTEEVEGEERGRIRFWATREQMLSLARHGASVCAAGRPRCQLCGNPIGPEGHQCPALNGHRESAEE